MIDLVRTLIPYLKPHWNRVIASLVLAFPLAAIKTYQAFLVKDIFDKGLSDKATFDEAMILAAVLLGLGILNYPFRFFHFYWIRYVVDSATCTVRSDLYKKLQRLPLSFYSKSKQGTLISNMLSDAQILSEGFRNCVAIVREPLTALALFGLALYRDWQLTLVIIVVAPLFILIFQKSGKLIRRNMEDVQENIGMMTHNVSEGVAGQKITKAFNLQEYVYSRFQNVQESYFRSLMRTTKVEENAHPLVELVGAIAFSGVILFAHHRIATGELTTGGFISFVTALALLMDPIRKYTQANVKLNQASAAGDRIFKILAVDEEKDFGEVDKNSFDHRIEIKNVTFGYGEGDVIKDFSLTIDKGESVALVGLSGSGKSTLINLLLKLYPIEKGEILIDGTPIEKIKLSSLRSMLGLVSQDIFLFHDTIRENLQLGIEVGDSKIADALEIAGASNFIEELPLKIETVIGDRGTRLSGGQAQRITIARAFLKNTPILLFDEATSALDNESEKLVQHALDRLMGDKTVLAIAHRLTTIQNYNKIAVLKDGRKIEEGNHAHLMQLGGEYSKLYELSTKI